MFNKEQCGNFIMETAKKYFMDEIKRSIQTHIFLS